MEIAGATREVSIRFLAKIGKVQSLHRHGGQQVRASSLELPGGDIDTARGELLVRVADRALSESDFADIVLRTGAGTAELRLGDIAEIDDGYAETDLAYFYNGQPAVKLTAYRIGDETPIEVAEAVKEHAQALGATCPTIPM